MADARVQDLWVFPVKGCRGVRVTSARVTPTGLEHDRCWCIVDRDGVNVAALEAISKRKMPALATISVALGPTSLTLTAEGMPPLELPLGEAAYRGEEDVRVECSGKSTTSGGGWSFGFIAGKAHAEGSAWVSAYLNRPVDGPDGQPGEDGLPGKLVSGKRKATSYSLVRTLNDGGLAMEAYPPIFPIIAKSKSDPDVQQRFAGNVRQFSDFAPFLLVNQESARFLASEAGVDHYPIASFRGNIVVDTDVAWEEETWTHVDIVSCAGGPPLTIRKIKECPRCTVPCRDEVTGNYLFPGDNLKLWTTLKRVFPDKAVDADWGNWAGVFFGVYFGHGAQTGATLRVGDRVVVRQYGDTTSGWPMVAKWLLASVLLRLAAAPL